MIKIKRGLDLPIQGDPQKVISDGPVVSRVGLIGPDYVGMKPTFEVDEGAHVKKGQLLFTDKKTPAIRYTSPGTGKIVGIHRGRKRALLSVEIELDGDDQESFTAHAPDQLAALGADAIVEQLLKSGLWTAFRTRPFSAVPDPESRPAAIFIAAMDSNPLALDPAVVLADEAERFATGLSLVAKLTDGPVYVAKHPDAFIPGAEHPQVQVQGFGGPHPAGLVGTHIHFLDPVGASKTVWHIGYQDVLAVATLFAKGELDTDRIVSLAGPQVLKPRYLRTRLGASTDELTAGGLAEGENRIISGSVLSGRRAFDQIGFLGRYHTQVSVIREGREQDFLGWLGPGQEKHSVLNLFVSKLAFGKKFAMTTSTGGSPRAMVPVGHYEEVMPLDILPTQLLRALIVGDTDSAQELGCLELDEEDLALCTYVCTGKYDYGPILRKNLTQIEKDG